MKILYYWKYKDTPMFQWQKFHIFDDLILNGISIEVFNPLGYKTLEEANEALLNRIKSNRYDLFMTTSTEKDLFIEVLCDIKRMGVPTLLICFDNLTIPFAHKHIAPFFDLVWLTSMETKYLFDNWGVKSVFLPYAANPRINNNIRFDKQEDRILFIGTPYGSRSKLINTLLDASIPVTLYSNSSISRQNVMPHNKDGELLKEIYRMLSYPIGRKLAFASVKNKLLRQSKLHTDSPFFNKNASVSMQEMMLLYNTYTLSLSSITNRHTGVLKKPVYVVNLRNFEIPSAGGLLFCQYIPELNDYFENGKEAIYYSSEEEMIDKARFYLDSKNKMTIMEMKKNAYLRASSDHTWMNRFEKIFEELNLKI